MSTLPSEIESQEIGLLASRGHTVIFGLGMGWLAANVALRDEVERVTVVECDRDVIEIVEAAGAFDALPVGARRKLQIVEADAHEWRPDGAVHSLQADIWLRFWEPGKVGDVRRMQARVQAEAVYFWGQELDIWRHACRRAGTVPVTLAWATVRAIVAEDLVLPLILPDWPDYPEKIAAAASWWSPRGDDWWHLE